jgi:hypothetical protein
LFRLRPQLALDLLRDKVCGGLSRYTDVKIESADLSEIQPTEYRADLVLSISNGKPVLCVILEVQLSIDGSKRYSWPVYVATLRARWRCPVCLLVVCKDMDVARWAEQPIPIGCANVFIPRVVLPDEIPAIADSASGEIAPELAILSAVAHGRDPNVAKAAQIATIALGVSAKLDADWSNLYFDVILDALSEAARTAVQNMLPFKYEYQSDFAKRYFTQGRSEGCVEGRAALITRQLNARFGPLTEEVKQRIAASSIEELDAIGDRLLTAASLEEALTPKS